MSDKPTFVCAICREEFKAERSDDDAWQEAQRRFGTRVKREDCAVVCAQCFAQLEPVH